MVNIHIYPNEEPKGLGPEKKVAKTAYHRGIVNRSKKRYLVGGREGVL